MILDNAEVGITQGALALSADASDPAEILSFSGTGTLSTSASEMHVWTDGVASNTHRYRVDVPMNVSDLTKSGPGALVLSKANTINGTIRVNQGTLVSAAHGALGDADTPVLRIGAGWHSKAFRRITAR